MEAGKSELSDDELIRLIARPGFSTAKQVTDISGRGVGIDAVHARVRTLGGTVDNPYVAMALLSLAGFAHQTLAVTVITMASDLFKRNEVATVAGMAGTCGNAGVLIFSLLMGALVARIGYTPFFIGLAALDVLGAIILWTVVREHRPEHTVAAAA